MNDDGSDGSGDGGLGVGNSVLYMMEWQFFFTSKRQHVKEKKKKAASVDVPAKKR